MFTIIGASEQIRGSPDVKTALEKAKEPGESDNDGIQRLIEERLGQRGKAIHEGAGLWEGTNAADGAQAVRESMKDELDPNG